MNYSHQIIINLPRDEVVRKFTRPENYKFWQKSFISYSHISGTKGEKDARCKLIYKKGVRKIEVIESILKVNLPDILHCSYQYSGIYKIQKNYFEEETNISTRWIIYNEYEFSTLLKFVGIFLKKRFKSKTYQSMKDFKTFAEDGKSVNN